MMTLKRFARTAVAVLAFGCTEETETRADGGGRGGSAGVAGVSGGQTNGGTAGTAQPGTAGSSAGRAGAANAGAGAANAGAGAANAGAGAIALPTPPGEGGVPEPNGAPGGVEALDWAGFKAAVSYTFDDTNSSQIEHYPALRALGVRMTFYLVTGKPEADDDLWARAVADGHELGNHTESHGEEDDGSDTDIATAFIERRFGVKVWTMAAPYGLDLYEEIARSRFLANRAVWNELIAADDDELSPFSLPCFVPDEEAPAAAFNEQIDSARDAGKWRIVLVHGFTGGDDFAFQPVEIGEFIASVKHAQAFGDVWIDSVVNVTAYWLGQRAFRAATRATSGDVTTYTWTLPEHFPPGRSLRVTAEGGILEQSGKPLSWNDHGYYEVALDARSLTVSPGRRGQ